MRISLEWLKTLVDVPEDTDKLVRDMALTGTEVESIESTGASLDGVVVGRIEEKYAHPNADTLWVTKVDVGADELLQIVCGAQNFEAGDKVAVATVGTVLPGDFRIKKSKLRGEVSEGMNCSGAELGVTSDADGILILPEDAPICTPYALYAGLSDLVLDCEITPNRPDCLSMVGIAREIGAIYDTPHAYDAPALAEGECMTADLVSVAIEDPERSSRYVARVITGIEMRPTPDWMVRRLEAAGARSVNLVADVTNYVMFLLGQPLHAFDLDTFPEREDGKKHVLVRAAHEGERFTTLDGQERKLTEDMTLITDGEKPVALAGVMGGLESEVTDGTVNVLLESAIFSPAHTSRTSRNLSLISEASVRFERGVNAENAAFVADVAAALIAELAGGTVCAGAVDEWPVRPRERVVRLRYERLRSLVGADITDEYAARKLELLGCSLMSTDEPGVVDVTVPSFRPDLEREVDLIEEVLRLWGMENVPATIPAPREHAGGRSHEQLVSARISRTLRALGLNETLTYAFAESGELDRLRMSTEGRGEPAVLINPLPVEQAELRRSLIPTMLGNVAHNLDHEVRNVQLFQVGDVFFGQPGVKQPEERRMVAAVLSGSAHDTQWYGSVAPFDFHDIKGIVETLLFELHIEKVRYVAADPERDGQLFPGRGARVLLGKQDIGWLGELHPSALEAFDIDVPVMAFELDHDALVAASKPARTFTNVPTMPAVTLDLAFVVDDDVTAERMSQVITSAGGSLLESARLFDLYEDEGRLGAGKKSLAYKLTFRAPDRTLTSAEVDKVSEKIVRKVQGATGAEIRG